MSTKEPISVVIRAWNEAAQLEQLLDVIARQDYPGEVELIVVDSGSTDDTAQIATRAGAKVVTLPQAEFTYPKALNLGFAAATKELVAELVAHALPVNDHWLSNGARHFADPQVVGVYAPPIAPDHGGWAERLSSKPLHYHSRLRGVIAVKKPGMGVFGATNIMMRRSAWRQHPFDERYAAGGEDEAWAKWALQNGYRIIRDPDYTVYHSHGLGIIGLLKQVRYWQSLKQPQHFSKTKLRKYRTGL